MSITNKQNRSIKNSLVPNLISVVVKNHNGYTSYQETIPPAFYLGTMKRLKEEFKDNYTITTY